MKFLTVSFFLITVLFSATCSASAIIQKLSFTPDKENAWIARVGDKQLMLTDPDNRQSPRLWDSALTVRDLKTQKLCSTEGFLAEAVYLYDLKLAIVEHFSGSTTYIDFIDLETCKEKYPGIQAYTEGIEVRRDRITIQPACEPAGEHISQCSSAHVYALEQAARPVLLERESIRLTQKILGVGFLGPRYVYKPRTHEAKFITAPSAAWMPRIELSNQRPSVHQVQVNGRELILNYLNDGFFNMYSSLTITDVKTDHVCRTKTWPLNEIYLPSTSGVVLTRGYSSKRWYIGFLDTETCKEKFPRIEYDSYPTLEITHDRIVIVPTCEDTGQDKKAVQYCTAARIYGFASDYRPILLDHESAALTRQIFGVEFSGYRQVENPQTQQAKLLPEEKEEGWFSSIKKWFSS